MQAWQIWIILGIILSIMEVFTPGFLIINFGLGAIITGIISLLGIGLKAQLAVFSIISLTFFILSRKIASKILSKDKPEARTNVEALKGKFALVTEKIEGNLSPGMIKVGGEEWSAIGEVDGEIEVGEKVSIVGIEGNKLIVKKAV